MEKVWTLIYFYFAFIARFILVWENFKVLEAQNRWNALKIPYQDNAQSGIFVKLRISKRLSSVAENKSSN